MNWTDLWHLAWRGLVRRPVRTALTTLGITVAVASMVIFLSLGEGIRKVFTEQMRGVGPDIQVSLTGMSQGGFSLTPNVPQSLVGDIEKLAPELGIESVTPTMLTVRGGLDPSQGVFLYGVPAQAGIQALFPDAAASLGRDLRPQDVGQPVAVLGAKAAQNLHLGLGSTLNLNRRSSLKVVGILAPGAGLVDSSIFMPLDVQQRAEGVTGQVSMIAVKVRDVRRAQGIARTISERLNVEAQTQADLLGFLEKTMRISDAVRFGISLIALVVGGLAVANTVMMGVFERTREFGTLRAIGARPGFVRALVLSESLLLSLLGGIGGVLLGLLGIWGVNAYTQNLAGIDAAALTPRLTLLALSISLLLGLFSGLLPARNASRLSITEALGRV
ncbi:MAG: ABC transporter permease [Deinococcus sp.]|uniref:ABC transporter permease n=1 Tax=Deinococcus sp. TaxID=47478 RepID=UPI0026DC370F|nr:ABC transporter permease [Deinococcus sp.]MDO4244773.1 ABC transporter permease [Deinococcus sp.]